MRNPLVTLTLENNQIINIELFPEIAPNTVGNFISLVSTIVVSFYVIISL